MFALETATALAHNGVVLDESEIAAELDRRKMRNVDIAQLLGIEEDKVSKTRKGRRRWQVDELLELNRYFAANPVAGAATAPAPAPPPLSNELADPGRGFAMPPPTSLPRDVPVLGSCLAAPLHLPKVPDDIEQIEMAVSDIVDYVRRPPAMAQNRGLYALYVQTASMEPRHRVGSLIFVDPRRPPSIGDDVIVQLRDGNGHDGDERVTCALLKNLVRRTLAGLELQQFNPPLQFFVSAERIKAVHRVPEVAELMGV